MPLRDQWCGSFPPDFAELRAYCSGGWSSRYHRASVARGCVWVIFSMLLYVYHLPLCTPKNRTWGGCFVLRAVPTAPVIPVHTSLHTGHWTLDSGAGPTPSAYPTSQGQGAPAPSPLAPGGRDWCTGLWGGSGCVPSRSPGLPWVVITHLETRRSARTERERCSLAPGPWRADCGEGSGYV